MWCTLYVLSFRYIIVFFVGASDVSQTNMWESKPLTDIMKLAPHCI